MVPFRPRTFPRYLFLRPIVTLNPMRFSFLAVLLSGVTSYADCMAPRFETHCVTAKVTQTLVAEPDIKNRKTMDADPNWDWSCRKEISLKGYKGSAYLISKSASCPDPGKEVYGDLFMPCNDAGQRTPVFFAIRKAGECK